MDRTGLGEVVVPDPRVPWHQINVVQGHVVARVEALVALHETNVDERSSIEPETIYLVDDKYLEVHSLTCQELCHLWDKLGQLVEPVSEWYKDAELVVEVDRICQPCLPCVAFQPSRAKNHETDEDEYCHDKDMLLSPP